MDSTQPQHTNRQYEEDLRGLRAGLRGYDARGAGTVFDDELLLQAIAQLVAENAHADVGNAAGTVRHDQGHRAVGVIGVSSRDRCRRKKGGEQHCGNGNNFAVCTHERASGLGRRG